MLAIHLCRLDAVACAVAAEIARRRRTGWADTWVWAVTNGEAGYVVRGGLCCVKSQGAGRTVFNPASTTFDAWNRRPSVGPRKR